MRCSVIDLKTQNSPQSLNQSYLTINNHDLVKRVFPRFWHSFDMDFMVTSYVKCHNDDQQKDP